MDLDPPLPRGNLFLSPTSSVRSAKFCEVCELEVGIYLPTWYIDEGREGERERIG